MKLLSWPIWRSPSFYLFLIFALALFLRLFHLEQIPFGLHEDEMMNGYVGRFILLNGKDLYSNPWPLLYFDNFGDYPNVIPMYISGIFTFILGLSAFAVRFPIAVIGSVIVFPVFWISQLLFKSSRISLLAAALIAITPWHIILSRSTAENILATTVYFMGVFFLLKWLNDKRPGVSMIILAILFFALTYVLYPGYRIVTPLTMFFSVFFGISKKQRLILSAITICFFLLTFSISKTHWGQGRFQQTSIFYFNHTVQGRLDGLAVGEGQMNVLTARIFHNKIVGYSREFLHQYVSYFSFPMLFSEGGLPGRYRLDDSGLLYYSYIIIIVVAFLSATFMPSNSKTKFVWSSETRTFLFLLLLFLISPIPSSLTLDDVPNVHRTVSMSVFFVLLTTYAFAQISTIGWKRIQFRTVLLVLVGIESVYFWHQWMIHAPSSQTAYRGDDRTALAKYVIENEDKFDQIYLPQDAKPLYYLFYSNSFDASLSGQFQKNIRLSGYGKVHFTKNNCPSEEILSQMTPHSLLVDRGECTTNGPLEQIAIIKRVNATDSFRAYMLASPIPIPTPHR